MALKGYKRQPLCGELDYLFIDGMDEPMYFLVTENGIKKKHRNKNYSGREIENGDYLIIFDPKTKKKIWSGVIDIGYHGTLSYGLHQKDGGPDWTNYFRKEYPAKVFNPKIKKHPALS